MKNAYYIENDQKKIHLNLPAVSWEILSDDIKDFSDNADAVGYSNFINRIIINYIESKRYPAYINKNINEIQDAISRHLKKSKIIDSNITLKKAITDTITNHYIQEIKNEFSIPKDIGKKIDLNKDCCYKLSIIGQYDSPGNEPAITKAFETVPLLIRAILIDYTRRPLSERCIIYGQNNYDRIQIAVVQKKSILLTFKNTDSCISVIPLGVIEDSYHVHSYLVGLREDTRNINDPVLRRFENIWSVEFENNKTFLTVEEKKQLKKMIAEKGVGSLRDKLQEYKIQLTEKGEKKYRELLFQRPHHEKQTAKEKEAHIYRFIGTSYQIKNYFRRLGSDAVIISPAKLHNEILQEYMDAVTAYKNIKTKNKR